MERLIRNKIQEVYAGLRPSEQKVADYFWKYEGKAGDLLIEQVAKKARVSQPTVIRFVKALGYGGIQGIQIWSDAGRNPAESSGKNPGRRMRTVLICMGFSCPAGMGWR